MNLAMTAPVRRAAAILSPVALALMKNRCLK
jgi:hypothetical protein